VRDLNGDGATDAVFTASTPLGPAVVAVLDRPSPLVVNVAPLEPEGGYIYAIESGRHGLSGCFDGPHGEPEVQGDRILDPADGELSFPHGGFGVSDGWWIVYYHFREDGLHQEGGSGC
jgi:hypothetical protein